MLNHVFKSIIISITYIFIFPLGLKGEKGQKGQTGLKGTKGSKGAKGEKGMKGLKGSMGQKGKATSIRNGISFTPIGDSLFCEQDPKGRRALREIKEQKGEKDRRA